MVHEQHNSRQLKIKTGVCFRLYNDSEQYKKDLVTEEKELDKLRQNAGSDEDKHAHIRQLERAHAETKKALDDVNTKMELAKGELSQLVHQHAGDNENLELVEKAQEILAKIII